MIDDDDTETLVEWMVAIHEHRRKRNALLGHGLNNDICIDRKASESRWADDSERATSGGERRRTRQSVVVLVLKRRKRDPIGTEHILRLQRMRPPALRLPLVLLHVVLEHLLVLELPFSALPRSERILPPLVLDRLLLARRRGQFAELRKVFLAERRGMAPFFRKDRREGLA